jgi:Sigma-70 region 2
MNTFSFDRDKAEPALGSSTAKRRNYDGLVKRLKARDEEVFETLVRRYGGRMLATARRLLGNEHDANDAVQQAFISVFRSIASFKRRGKAFNLVASDSRECSTDPDAAPTASA